MLHDTLPVSVKEINKLYIPDFYNIQKHYQTRSNDHQNSEMMTNFSHFYRTNLDLFGFPLAFKVIMVGQSVVKPIVAQLPKFLSIPGLDFVQNIFNPGSSVTVKPNFRPKNRFSKLHSKNLKNDQISAVGPKLLNAL